MHVSVGVGVSVAVAVLLLAAPSLLMQATASQSPLGVLQSGDSPQRVAVVGKE